MEPLIETSETYELDAEGVEIIPFDPKYKPSVERGMGWRSHTVNVGGRQESVHAVVNFPHNLEIILDYLEGEEFPSVGSLEGQLPARSIEQFEAAGGGTDLQTLAARAPNLYAKIIEYRQQAKDFKDRNRRHQLTDSEKMRLFHPEMRSREQIKEESEEEGRRIIHYSRTYQIIAEGIESRGYDFAFLYT